MHDVVPACRSAACRLLYVRPSTDGEMSGWDFFLRPLWNSFWGDDEMTVTLDISMPYGGKGFETVKGALGTYGNTYATCA